MIILVHSERDYLPNVPCNQVNWGALKLGQIGLPNWLGILDILTCHQCGLMNYC